MPRILHEVSCRDYFGRYFIWESDSGHYFLDLDTPSVGKTVGVFDSLEQAKAHLETIL